MTGDSPGDIHREMVELRELIHEQAETIERLEQQTRKQQARIEELDSSGDGSISLDRRGALKAGGVLGLLGFAGTTASANPSGQIGSDERPLQTINTAEIGGPVVEEGDTITELYPTGSSPGTIPRYGDDGSGTAVLEFPDAQAQLDEMGFGGPSASDIGEGAIVESGTNDDGSYVRWEHGVQVCFKNGLETTGMSPQNDYFREFWDYPASFSDQVFATATRWDHFFGGSNIGSRPEQRRFSDITDREPESNSQSRFYVWVDDDQVPLDDDAYVTLNCFAWGFWD